MSEKKCLECEKDCPCECLEIDTGEYGSIYFCSMNCYEKSQMEDGEFGQYEGHYAECKFGGHFVEKWKEVVASLDIWRKLAEGYNKKLHEIGYYKK